MEPRVVAARRRHRVPRRSNARQRESLRDASQRNGRALGDAPRRRAVHVGQRAAAPATLLKRWPAPDSQCSRVHPELHRLVAVPFCQPCETVRPRPRDDRVEAEMRVYIWSDGAAMPNGGPAGAGYVVVGGVRLLGSDALGDATNNVAEYTAVRNALRAAADAGATSAHVRMDSPVVFGQLSGASRARAEHLIQLKE